VKGKGDSKFGVQGINGRTLKAQESVFDVGIPDDLHIAIEHDPDGFGWLEPPITVEVLVGGHDMIARLQVIVTETGLHGTKRFKIPVLKL
jgi:hypothetical protein